VLGVTVKEEEGGLGKGVRWRSFDLSPDGGAVGDSTDPVADSAGSTSTISS
jgi:hypothetical protein